MENLREARQPGTTAIPKEKGRSLWNGLLVMLR
jgi:hypothetical protein